MDDDRTTRNAETRVPRRAETTRQQLPPEAQRDFGSEQLPTEIGENPWDVPSEPGGLPPSEEVAGDGATDTSSGEVAGSGG
jgi:hypothetical protein